MSDHLTSEHLTELRRPFTTAAVRWKVQTKPGRDNKAFSIYYIDARLVAERLNEVVGAAGWWDSYRPLFEAEPAAHMAAYFPVECSLTLMGVTRTDVGVYQRPTCDDIALKAAYSDAFKRAGVKFGIGAYLAFIPKLRAEVEVVDGKARGFTPAGEEFMRRAYDKWLGSELNRFGKAIDHGDVDAAEVEAVE